MTVFFFFKQKNKHTQTRETKERENDFNIKAYYKFHSKIIITFKMLR